LPLAVLGTAAVGYFSHCADAVEDQVSNVLTAIAETAERMMEWRIFSVYLRSVSGRTTRAFQEFRCDD
jgi:hypothetical protein